MIILPSVNLVVLRGDHKLPAIDLVAKRLHDPARQAQLLLLGQIVGIDQLIAHMDIGLRPDLDLPDPLCHKITSRAVYAASACPPAAFLRPAKSLWLAPPIGSYAA